MDSWVPHPDYDKLPEAIKVTISERDYACMPDEERRNLQQDMTMPEYEED